MKPVIERELEAIRQMVRDLERRLKNEREQLGHREVFDYGRRGEVPAPTLAQRGYSLTTDGWALVSGSGGGGLATVEVDNLTIGGDGSSDSPLSASLLSGTIDARIKNLSGTIDGHFNALDFLSSVASDDSISGDGTVGNPLSAYSVTGTLSGTIDGAIKAILTSSQVWSQTADGSEGTTLQANLPHPFPDTSYYAFVTNYSGSQNPVFKTINKTAYGFQVVSTAPFANGDRVDLLAISGGLGPVADGTGLVSLSGTINSAIVHLSSTLAGGSSVGRSSIWDAPTTAHLYDDEFENVTLDSSWSFTGSGGVGANQGGINPYDAFTSGIPRYQIHTDYRRSWLTIQCPSDNIINWMYKKAHDLGDFFVWTRAATMLRSNRAPVSNDGNFTLFIGSSSSLNGDEPQFLDRINFSTVEVDANVVAYEISKTQGGVGTVILNGDDKYSTNQQPLLFESIGIQKIGTTYHFWGFTPSEGRMYLESTTWTGSVDMVGFLFQNQTSTEPGSGITSVDFIRFVSSSVWLP